MADKNSDKNKPVRGIGQDGYSPKPPILQNATKPVAPPPKKP